MNYCETVTLKNKRGLHARAASKFVKVVKRFAANVAVEKDGVSVGGKSIMGLMMLNAPKDTAITITCDGPEAELVLAALIELVKGKFGED